MISGLAPTPGPQESGQLTARVEADVRILWDYHDMHHRTYSA